MNLKEFSRVLMDELGAKCLVSGDGARPVRGLAMDEPVKGWLVDGEAVVTARDDLDETFLEEVAGTGAPALIWRTGAPIPNETRERAKSLGLALFALEPGVPLRRLVSMPLAGDTLLLHSHAIARALMEVAGGEFSTREVTERIAELLGRPIVVEDAVGRLLGGGSKALSEYLEAKSLRASRGSSFDETRRERRDRYARLPDGYLSVPVERWRVGEDEVFWTPIGTGTPAGYLWVDLTDAPLTPADVVILYWARRILEVELGKERVRLETELGVRGDFVDDLIAGHYGSVELLLQRAVYLGADLVGGAMVLIVDIDDFARYLERRRLREPAIQELKKRLADAVRLQARELFTNFLLGPRSDNVILFLGGDEGGDDVLARARLLAERVQRYVKGLLPDLTVSVGIGRYKNDPTLLGDAYGEAAVALEIGHRIHGPSSISTFEGTGTYKLLFRVLQEDPAELEAFYTETLGPVVEYDQRYSTELVHTLTAYLRNDTSTVKTAGELFAHRHTIRYRLDRIDELTGLDVEKSEDRERLTLGIKAMQLLGRVPKEPSSFTDR